jgi:hypothetical protein
MLTGVIIFLLVVIALLAIPVVLTFQVSRQRTFQGGISVIWLFGWVRVQRPLFQSRGGASNAEQSVHKISRSQHSSGKGSTSFAIIRDKTFRRRVIRFLADFWQAIDKENINLRMRIGLGDPADTGQLWAIFGPLAGVLACIRAASIDVQPDFTDTRFELDSSGHVRLIPLQLMYLLVGLLLSPSFWQGIRKMRAVE